MAAPAATRLSAGALRVCLVSREYPPDTGQSGVGTYMHSIAQALTKLGHDVSVVSLAREGEREYSEGGIRVRRIVPRRRRGLWRLQPWLPIWNLEYSASVFEVLRELHDRQPFDVIQFPEWGFEGYSFSRRPLCPFVVKIHGPMFLNHRFDRAPRTTIRSILENRLERTVVLRADAIIASSRSMKELAASEWDIPRGRMALIPNTIDLDSFVPGASGFKRSAPPREVLYVGRLEYRKGVHVLGEAVAKVRERHPQVHFTCIGGDTPTAEGGTSVQRSLEERLAADGIRDAVSFLGAMPRQELIAFYQRADCLVMPSLYEPVGFTGMEAMACGTPVVTSDNSGLAEWLEDGVSGCLARPGDAEHLAARIVALLDLEPGAREAMGRAARDVAEQFSYEALGRQLSQLYHSVVTHPRAAERSA
jgi:glycosyltransferase involved in cell wall biosynthesis